MAQNASSAWNFASVARPSERMSTRQQRRLSAGVLFDEPLQGENPVVGIARELLFDGDEEALGTRGLFA